MARPLLIGNCSGFYGDRFAAMREMLDGGDLDVLTGDYLAELTMLLLWRTRAKDPERGYASSFLRQLEDCLGTAWERGVRIVTNAGGLNPVGCADAVRELSRRLGLAVPVASVDGDDLLPGRDSLADAGIELPVSTITANAYLGGWGIAAALDAGAQVVVTGRVTDAALVIGPSAWWHGWTRGDIDPLAGALVAGHVLECGTQATGGNYSFFTEIPELTHPGFPLAEVAADGSAVITKHPGTDGRVDVGTVTAQLLYETQSQRYLNPDVTADFSTIALDHDGPDRVRISGARGLPPPDTTKVCVNTLGGYRNSMTFLLTGLEIDAKADLVRRQLGPALRDVDQVEWTLARTGVVDPPTNPQAVSALTVSVRHHDAEAIGRPFSSAAVELALASYPGCTLTAPPGDASPYGVYVPMVMPNSLVEHRVALDATAPYEIVAPAGEPLDANWRPALVDVPPLRAGKTKRLPLGSVFGARSGDKGGDANLGVWARTDDAHRFLAHWLTTRRLRELLPEIDELEVARYPLPNLRAVNFVIRGLLGDGVAASTRQDPQAKGLAEWFRSREADIPTVLVTRS